MNKVALVTGASKGIGKAVAIALAAQGYDIAVNYHSSMNGALDTVHAIESLGCKAVAIRANVGEVKDVDRMFSEFESTFGHLDLLVNNAGVSMFAPFLQVSEEMWDTVNSIDWKGTYFCAQRAARMMVEKHTQGVILNVSSNQKDGCWPTASVYGPVKAAIAKFTRNVAYELAPYGIRVVAIAPGYTDVGWPLDNPIHEAKTKIPLKRFATTAEIAQVICRMVSDEFAYMTGSCLDIDGGALLPIVTENALDTVWSSTKV
jgi:NAD(P)-dependent dehydrogenase (short-subunit alcohol dehydrogenase family)